jgi:hypothetical protein
MIADFILFSFAHDPNLKPKTLKDPCHPLPGKGMYVF